MSAGGPSTVVFLHTAPALVPVFDRLMSEYAPQFDVRHVVRDDLLRRAVEEGEASPAILNEAAMVMRQEMDRLPAAVICTCSTIGESVDLAAQAQPGRFCRIDQAMAAEAVERGARIHVMATLGSTIGPTLRLIEAEAARRKQPIRLTHEIVPGARDLLLSGDKEAYLDAIAASLEAAAAACDVVVLAQASMGEALDRVRNIGVPVLSSPEIGVKQIIAELSARRS